MKAELHAFIISTRKGAIGQIHATPLCPRVKNLYPLERIALVV
jgi:hypothetical protein